MAKLLDCLCQKYIDRFKCRPEWHVMLPYLIIESISCLWKQDQMGRQIKGTDSYNITCLTLSSLASISTTSVSTSSIFALKNKSKERSLVRVCVCGNCLTGRKKNTIKVIYLIGKQIFLQSACDFPRSQKPRGLPINPWQFRGPKPRRVRAATGESLGVP